MKYSVIIPIYGHLRDFNIKTQLHCLSLQTFKDFDVTIVEQRFPGQDYHVLNGINHIKIEDPQDRGFNKSWCMNVAARSTGGDNLVFMDADLAFDDTYMQKIDDYYKENGCPYFNCWDIAIKLPGKCEPVPRHVTPGTHISGLVFFIERELFWKIGAMNEVYFRYGSEDNDMWIRVNAYLGERDQLNIKSMPFTLVHWYHDDMPPAGNRFWFYDRTVQNMPEVSKRLFQAVKGDPFSPHPVDFSDLVIDPGPASETITTPGYPRPDWDHLDQPITINPPPAIPPSHIQVSA